MTLTRPPGPLAGTDGLLTNYRIDGPRHRLLMHPFPRRVRAQLAGQTVLDTRAGVLLHETGLAPQLYLPDFDLRRELLEPTGHHTYCPFKGEASYYSVRVGDRVAENAVWYYSEPKPEAGWLTGMVALYWRAMDRWLDEDEQAVGNLPDPFHRVDVRATGQQVRVLAEGPDGPVVVAESTRALLLSETGLPNRYYLPAVDVAEELLVDSPTSTACPYKGWARYWSVKLGDRELTDAVWSYEQPLTESARIARYRCFAYDELKVELTG